MLGTRSIKTTAKAWAIDTAISMVDLTTLEGSDTPGKVRSLAAKARRPDPGDPTTPAGGRRLRLRRPRRRRPRGPAATAASTSPPSPPRSPAAAPAARSSSPTSRTPSPTAPTRSTWSSTAAPSSPAATSTSTRRSWPSRRPAATRPPQGHPRDRRAGHARQRPPRQLAGDARRRRLHQDLHRQDLPRRDPAGLPGHARGGARLPRRHRHARSASSRPAASGRRRTP